MFRIDDINMFAVGHYQDRGKSRRTLFNASFVSIAGNKLELIEQQTLTSTSLSSL